jgi:thymidylate synthase (FAD)
MFYGENMHIQTYSDMTIELEEKPKNAAILVGLGLSLTMRKDGDFNPVSKELCKFLIDAEHMSVFEHAVFTFLIQGISRSLHTQLINQRTASYISGSQHYQDYSNYPVSVHAGLADHPDMHEALQYSTQAYTELLNQGIPREEARQILPNASTVNMLWTLDARNLFYFLRQRLCNRNVAEMRVFAAKLRVLLINEFPALFNWCGPQCVWGDCMQGKMQCQEKKCKLVS